MVARANRMLEAEKQRLFREQAERQKESLLRQKLEEERKREEKDWERKEEIRLANVKMEEESRRAQEAASLEGTKKITHCTD